jgi:hypothetical protein
MIDHTTTVAVAATAGVSMLMAVIPADDPLAAWTQLGVAGASMGILFWIVSRRDPKVAELQADAARLLAEQTSAAIREAADTNAQALRDLVASQNEMQIRHHELVMKALHTQPPHQ